MESIYAEIAARTGGNIYIGVVGPVRTGKSTLVKRIMEALVIPRLQDPCGVAHVTLCQDRLGNRIADAIAKITQIHTYRKGNRCTGTVDDLGQP